VEEIIPELSVNSDDKTIADDTGNLVSSFTDLQPIGAELSEDKMNDDMELSETQPSEGEMADAAIEPGITLDTNLSIQNIVKLYDRLKKIYATHDAIEIDASHVASVDTATLQMLVALKKDAIKQNKTVDLFQPSPRFIESARLLDLVDMLEIIDI
jgi:ABC-type transporter Mla MlaB component